MELFRIPPSNEGTQPVTATDRDRKGTGMNVPSLSRSQGRTVVCETEGPFIQRQIFFETAQTVLEKTPLHEEKFLFALIRWKRLKTM